MKKNIFIILLIVVTIGLIFMYYTKTIDLNKLLSKYEFQNVNEVDLINVDSGQIYLMEDIDKQSLFIIFLEKHLFGTKLNGIGGELYLNQTENNEEWRYSSSKISNSQHTIFYGILNADSIKSVLVKRKEMYEKATIIEHKNISIWYYHVPNKVYKKFSDLPVIIGIDKNNERIYLNH